eukprot:COSAG05_NODE_1315_length_5211_cov_2.184077_3_plen_144_part_00
MLAGERGSLYVSPRRVRELRALALSLTEESSFSHEQHPAYRGTTPTTTQQYGGGDRDDFDSGGLEALATFTRTGGDYQHPQAPVGADNDIDVVAGQGSLTAQLRRQQAIRLVAFSTGNRNSFSVRRPTNQFVNFDTRNFDAKF